MNDEDRQRLLDDIRRESEKLFGAHLDADRSAVQNAPAVNVAVEQIGGDEMKAQDVRDANKAKLKPPDRSKELTTIVSRNAAAPKATYKVVSDAASVPAQTQPAASAASTIATV